MPLQASLHIVKKEIQLPVDGILLEGNLSIPEDAKGLVIFSHGSGSSRFSPRNTMVAEQLHKQGIATLLFDLLTAKEDAIYAHRFDIELLTRRLMQTTNWVMQRHEVKNLPTGLFGASTGAASALNTAAQMGDTIKAVVSRGGRPDLSIPYLHLVKAPVLLIVGGMDVEVIDLNRKAMDKITKAEKEMKIVPGATHLFSEPGKLEEVARISASWFKKHLVEIHEHTRH